jgi:hypothetical protein
MSVVPPLSGPPLYRYVPGIGRVGTTQNGPTGATGPAGAASASSVGTLMGKTLVVDSVYGSDVSGAANRYGYPFATIAGAMGQVSSGETIFVRPGTYTESVTMCNGIALRGSSVQTTTVTRTNVTSNVTLLTMGSNCRVEDMTFTLTSLCNVNLTGVDWPSGTPLTSKLRTAVVNVTSGGTNSNTIVGLLSAGSSATTYNASDATRSITVSVDASSSGPVRGLYVTGSNWFSSRDTNYNVRGTGANIVGVETTNAGSYASIKHSTVRGGDHITQPTNHDINRTAGEILLGSVDLANNSANGNSFSVTTEGAITHVGTSGNFTPGTYYLVPGFVKQGDLPTSTFGIPVTQNMILFSGTFQCTPAVPTGASARLIAYKNDVITDMSMTIVAGATLASNVTQSVDYTRGDTFDFRLVTAVSNMNNYTFAASVAFY